MKIIGATIGTPLPKPNFDQTDPKKGDYIKGDRSFLRVDDTLTEAGISADAKVTGDAISSLQDDVAKVSGLVGNTSVADQITEAVKDKADDNHKHDEYITESELNAKGYLTEHQSLADYAKKSYVDTKVADLVNSAPEKLNTLDELAAALGDDENFANTVTTELSKKANTSDLGSLATKSTVSKSDLAADIKTSIGKADTAIQSLDGYATEAMVNTKLGYTAQTLTEAQKSQARDNIGAANIVIRVW